MVLAVAWICAVANAASIYVGPCEGKIASTGIAKAGNCEVGAALKFPQELLAPYSGGMITGIRVGLVNAEGMEGFRAWIRPSLDVRRQPRHRRDGTRLHSTSLWRLTGILFL